ncbi:craniofacial development protein 1 [Culicoides brevitarsis]|uniref:craniofacial development protein 1 n=1 Tax=Culicoides brevitarsis TaxID=469753 RepID=UPI00307BC8CC
MSSDDSSDEEYKPQEEVSDFSKDSATDDSEEIQINTEERQIKRKRKTQNGTIQKRKIVNKDSEKITIEDKKDEDEKDITNALWASFLSEANNTKTGEDHEEKYSTTKQELSKTNSGPGGKSKFGLPRPGTSGLANALNQLEKKGKTSTLELSKLDWMNYKKDQGIEEELQTHNRGKNGFLERQDFLQRTDLRQFKREREIRQSKRSSQ